MGQPLQYSRRHLLSGTVTATAVAVLAGCVDSEPARDDTDEDGTAEDGDSDDGATGGEDPDTDGSDGSSDTDGDSDSDDDDDSTSDDDDDSTSDDDDDSTSDDDDDSTSDDDDDSTSDDDDDSSDGSASTAPDDMDLREANVVEVAFDAGDDTYEFDVALHHDDDGEGGYANWWQVERLNGSQLGRRELLHAHSRQPFTRSERIDVPDEVDCIVVRGHDQTHGYGGLAAVVDLGSGATRLVDQGSERRSFGPDDCP